MGSIGAKDVPQLLDANGRRIDGRGLEDLRPLRIEAGPLAQADGSAFVEWGDNKVMAAVYGPREVHPRHLQQTTKAVVQCRYNMAAFSVDERKRPGLDRRSQEISKVIAEAFESVLFVEEFPRTSIDIYIEVLQANAGTRCAGVVAASVALADAGIPMVDLVPAVAVGKVANTVVLDLKKEEDNYGEADLPMAMVPRSGRLVLLQMEGHMNRDELKKALDLGVIGCKKIYEVQKQALRDRYAVSTPAAAAVPEVPA
ncbi:MAG: exosome complex exonuclease Rrp41 [Euryarchaeota archaeon]|nr:exosome complex exonuclease Rrp41 [Euryarchaeota archaeon]MDE1836164.1 exosome complex exonuclease Rrp41 [Euryarchaeota archaeon]MDE1881019.1 exosome complex exonuclease Rrp41 [Euryarchaeota archaeon]MDE2045473.1 exosome complex exonuclease Rrp41 [Thermoplasmata archaeon]